VRARGRAAGERKDVNAWRGVADREAGVRSRRVGIDCVRVKRALASVVEPDDVDEWMDGAASNCDGLTELERARVSVSYTSQLIIRLLISEATSGGGGGGGGDGRTDVSRMLDAGRCSWHSVLAWCQIVQINWRRRRRQMLFNGVMPASCLCLSSSSLSLSLCLSLPIVCCWLPVLPIPLILSVILVQQLSITLFKIMIKAQNFVHVICNKI